MGLLGELKTYRDDRHVLIQLRHEIEHVSEAFKLATAGLKTRNDEYQEAESQYGYETEVLYADIAKIESKQMLRRAARWRIPVPHRPFREGEDNEFWEWNRYHGCYYLSDIAISRLRREAYQEWEMWSKPWLSWMAVIISVISLGFSVLRS